MKILFTSVGRRVELVRAFKAAAAEISCDVTIYGGDITESAPALYFCDERRILKRISDKEYIPSLIELCQKECIDCVIPTIDTDLYLLSLHKCEFEAVGTRVLISAPEKIRLCRDKNLTADYFLSLGLESPKPVNSLSAFEAELKNGSIAFPVFIKPKDGSSSIGAYKAENLEELKTFAGMSGDYIIQPFISGDEYTIDIFCDYGGLPVYITPRQRLAVRAGEVLKTRICQDDVMISQMLRLIEDFKPCGQITVQLIMDSEGVNHYIEINPRFGGGAPLSMKAGANSARELIRMLSGEKLCYHEKAARNGSIYSRFDDSICVYEGDV